MADNHLAQLGLELGEGVPEPLDRDDILVMQRPELTRLTDTRGYGVADRYETVAADFGFSGNYHEYPWMSEYLTDVSDEVNTALDHEKKVLIEGTQGFGLSLYHSDHYPKTTSRDTTAAGFLSEVGVSPRLVTEVVVVFRTFPIRVAGEQAGPLKDEITWEQLRSESGYPHPIEERTSVTNKIRRVARFDWELARKAVRINRATRVALNGLDYLSFANFLSTCANSFSPDAKAFVERLERETATTAEYLGVGPGVVHIVTKARIWPVENEILLAATLDN